MTEELRRQLEDWASVYEDPVYFEEDPIAFPRKFAREGACLQDIEIAAVFAAHFAWGRRSMIVRDCGRLFDEMCWRPYDYVLAGDYRSGEESIHRTVKWSDVASVCRRLREFYAENDSLESLSVSRMRECIYGQKPDRSAPNKKINMLRRWMIRRAGPVDLGLWRNSSPAELVIPLDVHTYTQAAALGLTSRKSRDLATALEITSVFGDIFPGDPARGDFALFGYGVTHSKK